MKYQIRLAYNSAEDINLICLSKYNIGRFYRLSTDTAKVIQYVRAALSIQSEVEPYYFKFIEDSSEIMLDYLWDNEKISDRYDTP